MLFFVVVVVVVVVFLCRATVYGTLGNQTAKSEIKIWN